MSLPGAILLGLATAVAGQANRPNELVPWNVVQEECRDRRAQIAAIEALSSDAQANLDLMADIGEVREDLRKRAHLVLRRGREVIETKARWIESARRQLVDRQLPPDHCMPPRLNG